ncbi:MAG: sugar transferase, partial [Candidatus Baltobacteraceae bacterium]
MSTAVEHVERSATGEYIGDVLPERLREKWIPIAALDLLAAVAIWFFSLWIFRDARSATIALTVILALAWSTGRYRRSFAVTPVDEAYATIALAIEAAAILVIVVPVFRADLPGVILAGVLWTVLAAYGSMFLCARRRGALPLRLGEAARIDHMGRVRARSPILHFQLRCADLLLSLIGTIVLAPFLAGIAIAIAIDSGSPVLFRQQRVGAHDRDFMMYKFRTMKTGAGNAWVTPGDERITRFGRILRRTSLDELPQLWNVFLGEMSLVGPRPEMREYADRF